MSISYNTFQNKFTLEFPMERGTKLRNILKTHHRAPETVVFKKF